MVKITTTSRQHVHHRHQHHAQCDQSETRVPEDCSHEVAHLHHHAVNNGPLPYIRESYVELPHAIMETFVGHDHATPVAGAAAGAIGVLAAARGVQSMRIGGTIHNIEGVGNLALAVASGLTAYEMFTEAAEAHEHVSEHLHEHGGHGFGAVTALEVAHGLAEIAVGGVELKKGTKRPGVSALRIAKGTLVLASQLIPSAAPIAQVLHLGTVVATTALDPKH